MHLNMNWAAAALRLALLAGAAAAMPAIAIAAAPQVRTQGPGYYRMMLGDFEITALSDGTHVFPVQTVMDGASIAQIEADMARDELALPVQGSINAFLVNTGARLILIDAGAGALYGDCCGRLLANLRAAGYQPEQVDEVLLTHLHKDHVGGILADGKMAFPNALLRVPQKEADYWLQAANQPAAPALLSTFFDSAAAAVAPYAAAGRLKPFAPGAQLAPGVRAAATPGHTPGHASYLVESESKTLMVWGDVIHVASIQLKETGVTVKYDSDAETARRSRKELLQLAASEHYIVGAAHIAFPGLGRVRVNGKGYDWIPVNYEGDPAGLPVLVRRTKP